MTHRGDGPAISPGPETKQDWPDLSGRLDRDAEGVFHRLPVRVYFEDTDFTGLVFHATYVRWCERGRSDFLRLLGNDHHDLLIGSDGTPCAFVVRRMSLEFLKPARIDEILEIETRTANVGAAHLDLVQRVVRGTTLVCEASVTVVLISLAGKPMRIAQSLRKAVSAL